MLCDNPFADQHLCSNCNSFWGVWKFSNMRLDEGLWMFGGLHLTTGEKEFGKT